MTAPKPGDRVRVTFEATWSSTWTVDDDLLGHIQDDSGRTFSVVYGATVEVLASPVYVNSDTTEYRHKDVVLDSDGDILIRNNRIEPARWTDASGNAWREAEAPRPLTLLVRDGKPVQP